MAAVAQSSSRRSFIKLAAAAPLLTQIAARNLYAQAATAMGKDPRQNVYTRLGVRTVINCRGTWTYLSGSLGVSGSSRGPGGGGATFRQYAGAAARRGTAVGGIDRRGIWNGHLRRGWRHGGCNRRVHGGRPTTSMSGNCPIPPA